MSELEDVALWSNGIPVCQISAVRKGRQKTAHGFVWKTIRTEVQNA